MCTKGRGHEHAKACVMGAHPPSQHGSKRSNSGHGPRASALSMPLGALICIYKRKLSGRYRESSMSIIFKITARTELRIWKEIILSYMC